MKKTVLIFLLMAPLGACTNDGNSPLHVMGAFPLTADCKQDDTIAIVAGAMDLAGVREIGSPEAAHYVVSFKLDSNLNNSTIAANGVTLDDSHRNDIYVTNVEFDYTSTPAISFAPENVSRYFTISPNTTGNYLITDLMSPTATATLLAAMKPGDIVTLNVGMTLKGTINGRDPITSNTIAFPITVWDSGQVCTAQSVREVSGCFGNSVPCVSLDGGI